MSYKTLLILVFLVIAAQLAKPALADTTATEDDLEYQVSDQAKQAKHANDFLRQVYKDINND